MEKAILLSFRSVDNGSGQDGFDTRDSYYATRVTGVYAQVKEFYEHHAENVSVAHVYEELIRQYGAFIASQERSGGSCIRVGDEGGADSVANNEETRQIDQHINEKTVQREKERQTKEKQKEEKQRKKAEQEEKRKQDSCRESSK